MMCTCLSLTSRSKRHLPTLNAPTWLDSAVVITQLFDAGSIWRESPRMPSADCVVRMSNQYNIDGCDIRCFWWNDTIATLAMRRTNSSAHYVQLLRFRGSLLLLLSTPLHQRAASRVQHPKLCGSQQSLPPGGKERLHFVGIRPEVQARKGGW